jgi:hypothetical protein
MINVLLDLLFYLNILVLILKIINIILEMEINLLIIELQDQIFFEDFKNFLLIIYLDNETDYSFKYVFKKF